MFCKWCGGTLTPSDVKCSRCGKAVPPLSDCGGFYDLIPDAERSKEAVPVQKMETMQAMSSVEKMEIIQTAIPAKKEGQRSKHSKKNSYHKYIYITLLGFVVIIALMIGLFIKINQYAKAVDELKVELNNVSEELSNKENDTNAGEGDSMESDPLIDKAPSEPERIDASDPSVNPSPSESTEETTTETTTEESIPAETASIEEIIEFIQTGDLSLEIILENNGDATVAPNFQEFEVPLENVKIICDREYSWYRCKITERSGGFKEREIIDFRINTPSVENGNAKVSIEFSYNPGFLGTAEESEATYEWKYRTPTGWANLIPNDTNIDNDNNELVTIEFDAEDLYQKYYGEGKDSIEIQCTLHRGNEDGGSLTVSIQGIVLSLDGQENNLTNNREEN